MAFLGVTSTVGIVLAIAAIFLTYSILWPAYLRPSLETAMGYWFRKRHALDTEESKRMVSQYRYWTNMFFLSMYLVIAYIVAKGFDIWSNQYVVGSRAFGVLALVVAWIANSHFMALALSGIERTLMKAVKIGQAIKGTHPYGATCEGTCVELGTHEVKLRKDDGSYETVPNKTFNEMIIRNYDYGRFHYAFLHIPVKHGDKHMKVADDVMSFIKLMDSKHIVTTLNDDETKWWNKQVMTKVKGLPEADDAISIQASFNKTSVTLKIPVRTHADALEFEHEFNGRFGQTTISTPAEVKPYEQRNDGGSSDFQE